MNADKVEGFEIEFDSNVIPNKSTKTDIRNLILQRWVIYSLISLITANVSYLGLQGHCPFTDQSDCWETFLLKD